jgi:hypothetical protein
LVLWEREDKRGCQFEDGELRVFSRPYFELLQPAKQPDPSLRRRLREQAAANGFDFDAGTTSGTKNRAAAAPVPTLDDQITVFESLYPESFDGQAWTEATRARAKGKGLKRHRDAAIAKAADLLSKEALRACIDAGDYNGVFARIVDVVGDTDLATRAQLSIFEGLTVDLELAESMYGFLHDVRGGDLATMARLRRALARHGVRKIAWPVITAPRALLYPRDHLCVRPSAVRAQAKSLMPRFRPGATPSADDYARCLELAMIVREELTKQGFAVRDLFDVAHFMRMTLAPKVKEELHSAMDDRRTALGE